MRNFSWTYFAKTGDVDAFMLYKEADQLAANDLAAELDGGGEARVLETETDLPET